MWTAVSVACSGGQERPAVLSYDSVELMLEEVKSAVGLGSRYFRKVHVETSWTVCRSLKSCTMPSLRGCRSLTGMKAASCPDRPTRKLRETGPHLASAMFRYWSLGQHQAKLNSQ
jgi:hypothetical protein